MDDRSEGPDEADDRELRLRRQLFTLGTYMTVGAVVVLVLSLFAAFGIFRSTTPVLPGFDALEAQGRLFGALATLAGGITASCVMAALGGILKLLALEGRPGAE